MVWTKDGIHQIIRLLGEAPDGQLATEFARRCAAFPTDADVEACIVMLRDLMDECVFCGGASAFVLVLLSGILQEHPETSEAMEVRRAALERRYGMRSGS